MMEVMGHKIEILDYPTLGRDRHMYGKMKIGYCNILILFKILISMCFN